MKPIETLEREYYCEQDGEIWVEALSKYTRLKLENEDPYSRLYLDPTGTSVFKSYTSLVEPIPYIVFEILKEIDNPHLVKLQRRFYCRFKDTDIERLQNRPTTVPIDAYTRKYVRAEKIDLLRREKDYLLENISELQKLFDSFSQKRVSANFRRKDDLRVDSNGIIITNPDAFIMNDDANLTFYNRIALLVAVRTMAMQEYSEQLWHPNVANANKALVDLFDSSMVNESDMAEALSKKLEGVKKPIQYIKKRI